MPINNEMKEEIAELIYDFAYVSGDGGTTTNSEAVDEIVEKITTLYAPLLLEAEARGIKEAKAELRKKIEGKTRFISTRYEEIDPLYEKRSIFTEGYNTALSDIITFLEEEN